MHLGVEFFGFTLLTFTKILDYVDLCLEPNWGNHLSPNLVNIFFLYFILSPLLLIFDDINIRSFFNCTTSPWDSFNCFFNLLFFMLFRLDNFIDLSSSSWILSSVISILLLNFSASCFSSIFVFVFLAPKFYFYFYLFLRFSNSVFISRVFGLTCWIILHLCHLGIDVYWLSSPVN